jgi:uncharacterized repeat protein (TIGR03806 family)
LPAGVSAIMGLSFACNSAENGEPAPSAAGSGGLATGGTASGGITASGGSIASAGASAGVAGGGAPNAGSGGQGGTLGGAGGALAGSGGASAGSGGAIALGPCRPPDDIDQPIEKLSQTGCMDPTDPRKMANFVIPYAVNSPLWSDGADKERGMVLPPGQKIHVKNCMLEPDTCRNGPEDDGDWLFPVGSVLIKNFLFDGKLVETRLFVHADAKTWVGYGYQWDEAQTEATVVPDETRKVMFNTGQRTVEWTYPSRYDCMLCHNKPAGYTLGPETRQLNRMENGKNLLDTLQELGAFDAPLPVPYAPALVTPYAVPEGTPPATAGNEELTRSYLHSNCAYCHRPEGDFQGIDMRLGIPFAQMGLCNAQPQKGGAGLTTGSLLTPGKPEESVLWARVKTLDEHDRMPQIGTYKVDEQGLKLITDWITAIAACP